MEISISDLLIQQTTYNNYERTGQRGRPKSKPSLSEEELAELKKEQIRKAVAKCRQKKAENKSQPVNRQKITQ